MSETEQPLVQIVYSAEGVSCQIHTDVSNHNEVKDAFDTGERDAGVLNEMADASE